MRVAVGEQGLHEVYELYKKKVKKPVEFTVFKAICTLHNKLVMQKVMEGVNFRVPFRLGFIRVKKTKMTFSKLKFDYGEFNKTGIKSFFLNDHSDGFKAKLLWEKSKCIVKGKRPYCFQPTREWKRTLAAVMKTDGGHKQFME